MAEKNTVELGLLEDAKLPRPFFCCGWLRHEEDIPMSTKEIVASFLENQTQRNRFLPQQIAWLLPVTLWSQSCDASGAFTFHAPGHVSDGQQTWWVVVVRVQQDIRDADTISLGEGCLEDIQCLGFLTADCTLKEAVALFLRPAMQRTKQLGVSLQGKPKQVVRFLEGLGASNLDADSPFTFVCPQLNLQGMEAGFQRVVGKTEAAKYILKIVMMQYTI